MTKIYHESNTEEQNQGITNAIDRVNEELPEIMQKMDELSKQLSRLCNCFPIHSKMDLRILTTSRRIGSMGTKIGHMTTILNVYYHQKNGNRYKGFWYTDKDEINY